MITLGMMDCLNTLLKSYPPAAIERGMAGQDIGVLYAEVAAI